MRARDSIRHNVPVAKGINVGEAPSVDQEPGLTPHESVPLLTAWVSRLGADLGIRTLVIKGPLMAIQGLRTERASNDVDVWVDPAQFAEFASALQSHGWVRRFVGDRHWIVPEHSFTMRRESWACELDVHHAFPGFFAPPQFVFEEFWDVRAPAVAAGADVIACNRVGNAAILALHGLRDLRPGPSTDDLHYLASAVKSFSPDERHALAALVAACGANQTSAQFLSLAGLSALPGLDATDEQLEDWRVLTSGHGAPSVAWLDALKKAPPWQWPTWVWRAFWLNEVELREAEPWAPRGALGLWRARLHRLRRGFQALPASIRIVLLRRDH